MIFEKSFDEHVTQHLLLTTFFDNIDWEPLFHLSGDYYLDLVREFYATMLHKTDKTLKTIISPVKGVHIVLDKDASSVHPRY